MSKLRSLKPFIPAYGFATLILIGSSIPTYTLHRLQRHSSILKILLSDFVIHFVAFAILTVLLSIGYVKSKRTKIWWLKAALVSMFVGVLVEVIQTFLPYRSFSTRDLGIDVIGIITALIIFAAARFPVGNDKKK
jgi:VanZ family protein